MNHQTEIVHEWLESHPSLKKLLSTEHVSVEDTRQHIMIYLFPLAPGATHEKLVHVALEQVDWAYIKSTLNGDGIR